MTIHPFISLAHVLQKGKFVVLCSFGSQVIVFTIRTYESITNSHSATLNKHDMRYLKITFMCLLHQDKY